jgi:hypothetical protein
VASRRTSQDKPPLQVLDQDLVSLSQRPVSAKLGDGPTGFRQVFGEVLVPAPPCGTRTLNVVRRQATAQAAFSTLPPDQRHG